MKILGIDVGGADYCTAYFIDHIPENPKAYIQGPDFAEFVIHYTRDEIDAALALEPDAVILEPTGGYEDILIHRCEVNQIPYRLANVGRVASFRGDMGIPKTDRYDAFALACFGIHKWNDRSAWVQPVQLKDLRELLMQRRQLMTQRRSLINQFRQRLHREFPEGRFDQRRPWQADTHGIFRWCQGEKFKRFNWWQEKINNSCGIGISDFTKALGVQIYEVDNRCIATEDQISQYLKREEFKPYVEVFNQFGFSQRLSAWWLTRCYPFDQFLGDDGRPISFKRPSKTSLKKVTTHLSLNRFKCILGAGTIPNTSGIRGESKTYRRKSRKSKKEPEYYVVGDRFCREAFVLWADKQIVTGRGQGIRAEELMTYYKRKKASGKPYYKCLGCLHGYTAKLVFKALVKATR